MKYKSLRNVLNKMHLFRIWYCGYSSISIIFFTSDNKKSWNTSFFIKMLVISLYVFYSKLPIAVLHTKTWLLCVISLFISSIFGSILLSKKNEYLKVTYFRNFNKWDRLNKHLEYTTFMGWSWWWPWTCVFEWVF